MLFGRPKIELKCSGCGRTRMVYLESEIVSDGKGGKEVFLTEIEDLVDRAESIDWLYVYDEDDKFAPPAELYCNNCKKDHE